MGNWSNDLINFTWWHSELLANGHSWSVISPTPNKKKCVVRYICGVYWYTSYGVGHHTNKKSFILTWLNMYYPHSHPKEEISTKGNAHPICEPIGWCW